MVEGVQKWGVGEKLPFDLPGAVASKFGEVSDFQDRIPLLAIGGFGQGNDQMVPLHMAMVASTVANEGQMMKPYAIEATLAHDGSVLDQTTPSVWKTPIRADTAATLTGLMVGVVNQGTARQMQLANGIQAAAKTGTAQLNGAGQPEKSNAWIIGFAPADAPKYAITVILKGGPNDEISACDRRPSRRPGGEGGARLHVRPRRADLVNVDAAADGNVARQWPDPATSPQLGSLDRRRVTPSRRFVTPPGDRTRQSRQP